MKKIFFLLIASTLFSFCLAQGPTKEQIRQVEQARKEVKKMKGQKFPEYAFTTMDGREITSEDTKGKYVLFNFWFTRCRPCIEEIPELNELVETYEDREDVLFIAPTFDAMDQVAKFGNKFEFKYQQVPNVKDFCLEMNVRSYPTHFIINPEGMIEKVVIGYSSVTVKSLKKTMEKLLASE